MPDLTTYYSTMATFKAFHIVSIFLNWRFDCYKINDLKSSFFIESDLRNPQLNISEYTFYRRLSEKLEMFSRILPVS